MKSIFVTVGTHPQQFNRLIEKLDKLAGEKKIPGKIFAQIGHSTYKPKNFEYRDFIGIADFRKKMAEADLVITHSGEGNIGLAKNLGKKMVVVPRKKEFGEHTNDHQLELAEVVEDMELGLVSWNIEELEDRIALSKNYSAASVPRGNIVQMLENFVEENF